MSLKSCQVPAHMSTLISLMQRVQDAAVHDYMWFATGQIDAAKWPSFWLKMDGKYDLSISYSTRSKRRKAGAAVCLMYSIQSAKQKRNSIVGWIMLVSEGKGRVHGAEQLNRIDSRNSRVDINGYELVHDGRSWSWQMSFSRRQRLKEQFLRIANRQPERRKLNLACDPPVDLEAEAWLDNLYASPGFRLVRVQVGELFHWARSQWQLRRGVDIKLQPRSFLPYVRRMKS